VGVLFGQADEESGISKLIDCSRWE